MRFLLFPKPASFVDGEWPPLRRRLSAHRQWTFACAFAGVMTLLPSMQGFAQENSYVEDLSRQNLQVPSAGVSTDAAMGISDDSLPDAPLPAVKRSEDRNVPVAEPATGLSVSQGGRRLVPLKECPYDKTKAPECRVHWRQLLISSAIFLTWQNT